MRLPSREREGLREGAREGGRERVSELDVVARNVFLIWSDNGQCDVLLTTDKTFLCHVDLPFLAIT